MDVGRRILRELIERFYTPAAYGGAESLRFRILLAPAAAPVAHPVEDLKDG